MCSSYEIWNRRYTGSKYKLSAWISDIMSEKCLGTTFCDMFAGTGIVSYSMLGKVDKIILNDFLYSNEIIYKGFFLQEKYNEKKIIEYAKEFRKIGSETINDNYVSENYGGRFFSDKDAKKIGEIRERISAANDLNEKEHAILLSSLLYSADRVANTVGHYDAYIKGREIPNSFVFSLINSYTTSSQIEIHREDSNQLARKIQSDIVYVDPPYNSRQYSRFYHVLENIVKWEKPELYGTALKPAPENMSEYCKTGAKDSLSDLIQNLKCNYIILSYNNTYNSKSGSSRNKIELEDIKDILGEKGTVSCYEKEHPYFNAGKTCLEDHKELLFVVEVKK